jgi:3-phenylpropionate/trans-cinnamate dioxygenase ferredoxin reductase subunit
MVDQRRFVIVGAGLAGAKAAETLREDGFDGAIVLIGDEPERPYERPPLSKSLLLGTAGRDSVYVHDAAWYAEHDVDLLTGTRVAAIGPDARFVELADGGRIGYDRLLLATGCAPRTLPVPGADLDGVLHLRTLADADRIAGAVADGGKLVIVGAGWIGLEVAAAARHHGATVTVVEAADLPLQRVLGDRIGRVFADLHRGHGVTFHFRAQVRELRGNGRVSSVLLADGTELGADAVLVAVGVHPTTQLAERAGLSVDNGIVVDHSLRTSDPHIYAAGDVANVDHPLLGVPVRVEHWANALHSGRAAASAMLGHDVSYDRLPYFYTDQYDASPGIGMEYSGYIEPGGHDQVVFRGDPAIRPDSSPEFIAFWVKDGRVLAGMNVNVWDAIEDIQKVVRAGYAGTPVDVDRLADPKVPLGELLD